MVRFTALDTEAVRRLQNGGPDANGQACERAISSGSGTPCRHCLKQIEKAEDFLILSYRPFPAPQPFAEQGPIFLHAGACDRHAGDGDIPEILGNPQYIVRGYDAADRIVYGTGQVTPTTRIRSYASELFENSDVAYIHVRSAANNCYLCRIDRS